MINIETLFLFLFIFSTLSIFRLIFKFIFLLLQNPPEKLILEKNDLIFYGIMLSYIITYLIKI